MDPAPAPVLAILSDLVEERAGLHYGPADLELLEGKAAMRAQEAGFESLLDYYYYLRYDAASGPEFDALVDALVVNETYFFREREPLEVLVREVLAPRVAAVGRARVWSAACATGEEPLSVAMLLAERGLLGAVDVVASDISVKALARARRGVYGPRSLRASAPPGADRWLRREGDAVVVSEELRGAVQWHRVNLLDALAVQRMGTFDAILCRNVLIYFSDDTTRAVISALTNALAPHGRLLVGVSESLMRLGTLLECEERGGAFFYRRRS